MKKQKMLRAVCGVMVGAMLLTCLAACGGGGKSGNKYVYVPEYTEVPDIVNGMGTICVSGETIYFTVSSLAFPDGTMLTQDECNEYYNSQGGGKVSASDVTTEEATVPDVLEKYKDVKYVTYLFSVKTDGTGYTRLNDYKAPVAEGEYSSANTNNICVDGQGNLWVLESMNTTIFDTPEGFNKDTDDIWKYYDHDEQTYKVRKLSPTGAEVSSIDLSSLDDGSQEYFYINYMAADDAGNIYIADSNNNIAIFSGDGASLGTIKCDGYVNTLVKLGDGKVYASGNNEEGKSSLSVVDAAKKQLGEKQDIPNQAWNFYDGGSNYDLSYSDGSSLYGFNFGDETPTKILTWINSDINSDYMIFSRILDDGNVFAISNNYDNDTYTCEFIKLVKTPASEVTQKTPITLGCIYLDYDLRSKVLKFNKTNDKYRIEIVDYSEYNTDDDINAGLTKLNTEIVAGNSPDIIAINNFSYDQYAAKGLLEDLYPYLDKDTKLSRDDFVPSILKIQETDGKLYHLGTGFTISSIVGSADVLGSESGWTMSELQDIIKQHPEADCVLGQNVSREDLFNMFLSANYENYIDWDTGKCSFDSDDFKNLLKFINGFPSTDDIDWENTQWLSQTQLVSEGRQLMSYFNLYDFNSIQDSTLTFGKNIVFKGYPCEDRNGTVANITGNMAITTTCKDKDAAWEFISDLYTKDAQENMWNGMPMNQKVFDEKLAEAMKQEYDENGNPISRGGWSDGTTEMQYYAVTQEQADQIRKLVNSVSRTALYDSTVIDLITDSVKPYLKGEKTVDAVASEVQSRMNIYVNEQR